MTIANKFLTHRYGKLLILLIIICLPFIFYHIYIWAKTQSTNNAYVRADISNFSSEIVGVIEEVVLKNNSLVEKGQVVAKIKNNDYSSLLSKAQLSVEIADHNIKIIEQDIKLSEIQLKKTTDAYEFAEENFDFAKANYKRIVELSKDKFASQKNLDDAKIFLERNKSELLQAQLNKQLSEENFASLKIKLLNAIAQQKNAHNDKDIAERGLNNTIIKSPIAGVIGNSSLREGNYIRPGVILFSVVPINELYIEANFKETQISKFVPGMKAQIIFDSMPDEVIMGTIRNISPATGSIFSLLPPSNATGNFTKIVQRVPVLIDFSVPKHMKNIVVPGMSALVKIKLD